MPCFLIYRKRKSRVCGSFFFAKLLILALACSFGLLLTLYAGLFVMLSFAKFGKHTGACALTLKATQSTVEGFALLQLYFCHVLYPSPRGDKLISQIRRMRTMILYTIFRFVSIEFAIFVWIFLLLLTLRRSLRSFREQRSLLRWFSLPEPRLRARLPWQERPSPRGRRLRASPPRPSAYRTAVRRSQWSR